MGGVATLVDERDKNSFVKVSEGENEDEFIITRHSNFLMPLNVINIFWKELRG